MRRLPGQLVGRRRRVDHKLQGPRSEEGGRGGGVDGVYFRPQCVVEEQNSCINNWVFGRRIRAINFNVVGVVPDGSLACGLDDIVAGVGWVLGDQIGKADVADVRHETDIDARQARLA
jgi:hypothetical protein